jgi:membrane-associated protein
MPASRFVPLAAIAGVVWTAYAGLIGYFGGRAFDQEPWKGVVVGMSLAATLVIAIEGVRAVARRWQDSARRV